MKALILAAGCGKRLYPITNQIPKAMVEVKETPLLINTIDCLILNGITKIGIVLGHKASYIKNIIGNLFHGATISYYENEQYMETNNIFSLYQAIDFCDDDMLMIECDIYYHKETIDILKKGAGACSILVSPFNPKTMDGTVIQIKGDIAQQLILGKWQGSNFDYSDKRKTVNMYRFTKEFLKKYVSLVQWYVENIGTDSYYEKVLGSLIYLKEYDVRIIEIPETMWCEVDTVEDLKRANEI